MENRDGFDTLQSLSWQFASHRVVTVAAKTGILALLGSAPKTTEQLAAELTLDPVPVAKILGVLCALALVEHKDDGYTLSMQMQPLFCGGEADMTAFMAHSHSMYDSWGENLEDWLRGRPWKRRPRSPEGIAAFGEAMRSIGFHVSKRLLAHLNLETVRSVLDVGGGTGTYAKAFCNASEQLSVTVFDTPETAALGETRFAGTPFESRIQFMGGDFLSDPLGTGFDVVLLSNVLHQEDPENARTLFRRAVDALGSGGRAVVVEFAIDDDRRAHLMGTLFSVNMRSFGNTYTGPVLRKWMSECGLQNIERLDLDEHRWMFVGEKPV